jgi:crotonobetainyl-CoA:carnitine CoA-transferase CaiB-like acyl-CoA transferase
MLLNGMKVLSFTHFIQGPSGAQYLADMGADVIKVEPLGGAWERKVGSGRIRVAGRSVSFLAVNRNQRAIAVDLKHPQAREVLAPIIAQCDVIMENYRPGALDRMGLGYDAVRAIKPDIIYASATGWGSRGPMADQPGVDILVQARSGLIAATGDPRRAATAAGTPIVDHHGATLFALGVLGAYLRKVRTGVGGRVEASLFAAGLDLQAESLALYFSGRKTAADIARDGRLAAWFIDAPYGTYALRDGHAVIALSGPMTDFAEALGSADLAALGADGRFADRDAFTRIVGEVLAGWTYADLDAALGPRGYWYARVAGYDDLAHDPQVAAEGLLAGIDIDGHDVTVLRHPVRYDGVLPDIRRKPPELGEHSRNVLAEAGFGAAAIDAFVDAGVVGLVRENAA